MNDIICDEIEVGARLYIICALFDKFVEFFERFLFHIEHNFFFFLVGFGFAEIVRHAEF